MAFRRRASARISRASRAAASGSLIRQGSGTYSAVAAAVACSARMRLPRRPVARPRSLDRPGAIENPRAAIRPDQIVSGGEEPPELLFDEARDRGAPGEAVVPRDGAQHLVLLVGRRERPDLLSKHGRLLFNFSIETQHDPTTERG